MDFSGLRQPFGGSQAAPKGILSVDSDSEELLGLKEGRTNDKAHHRAVSFHFTQTTVVGFWDTQPLSTMKRVYTPFAPVLGRLRLAIRLANVQFKPIERKLDYTGPFRTKPFGGLGAIRRAGNLLPL